MAMKTNSTRLLITLTILNAAVFAANMWHTRPVAASAVPDVLRAHALEIVDDQGRVRADIKISPATTIDGRPYQEGVLLHMADPNGLIRAKIGADHDGSGLMLANDTQQPGVHMLAKASGNFVRVTDKNGKEQVLKP